MGASGKWLKSLISLKKPSSTASDREEVRDKGKKKWRLWRSVSEGFTSSEKGMKRVHVDASGSSESTNFKADSFTAAMATVARAPAKEFMVVKQEWAAIRIQTSFRRFLAKQALRALKSVVRIQAIFRGRMVRKQADMTLKCMQALVRVQTRVRAQCMKNQTETASLIQTEKEWCGSRGTVDENRTKLEMREEAAIKRGRALAYHRSQKMSKSRTKSPKNHRVNKKDSGWGCGGSWMRENYTGSPSFSRKSEGYPPGFCSYYSEFDSMKVRRNNVTTRISARPQRISQNSRSSSTQSYESFHGDYSASSSPTSESTNLAFSSALDKEMAEESITSKPSYMNLTASTMAKQRSCKQQSSPCTQTRRLMTPTRSSSSPINSIKVCKNLYPPTPFRGHD